MVKHKISMFNIYDFINSMFLFSFSFVYYDKQYMSTIKLEVAFTSYTDTH